MDESQKSQTTHTEQPKDPVKSSETRQNKTNLHVDDEPSAVSVGISRRTDLPRMQKRTAQDAELSMILKMRGRALSQALMTIAGTRQRSGRLWMTCAATFLVIALLIIQVYYRHRELNLGYELSAAIAERESLIEENRKLRIELRVLSRRERLEPLAGKQLGMAPIRPEQVFIINVDKVDDPLPAPGKRLDGLDNVRHIEEN